MKTKEEMEHDLAGFFGTEAYHPLADGVVMTDGADYLHKNGLAPVMDEIASAQPAITKDGAPDAELLRDIQFWTLAAEAGGFLLTCRGDTGREIVHSRKFVDLEFPLPAVELYCAPAGEPTTPQVILLPSEY